MTESIPITYRRIGDALVPKQKWLFDRQFVDGHDYDLIEHEERSSASHAHYFATVNEAFKTLPESQSRRWANATHMRKWFLIKTGWSVDRTICAETEQGAKEISALAGQLDPAAVVIIQGNIVTVSVARTQKGGRGGMNKEEFQKSKQAVLEEIAAVLGVDVATLSSQVSNSSDAQQDPPSRDQVDAPAANGPHSSKAAGVSYSFKDPGWFDHYLGFLTAVREVPASLMTRHQTALKSAMDEPLNDAQRQIMSSGVRLVKARNEAALRKGEWDERSADLRRQAAAPIKTEQSTTKGAAA